MNKFSMLNYCKILVLGVFVCIFQNCSENNPEVYESIHESNRLLSECNNNYYKRFETIFFTCAIKSSYATRQMMEFAKLKKDSTITENLIHELENIISSFQLDTIPSFVQNINSLASQVNGNNTDSLSTAIKKNKFLLLENTILKRAAELEPNFTTNFFDVNKIDVCLKEYKPQVTQTDYKYYKIFLYALDSTLQPAFEIMSQETVVMDSVNKEGIGFFKLYKSKSSKIDINVKMPIYNNQNIKLRFKKQL